MIQMVTEKCPHCKNEVEIPAKGVSKCPACGYEIWPYSMSDNYKNDCIHDKK